MKIKLTLVLVFMAFLAKAQLLTWTPDFPTDASPIDIVLDANYGNKALLGYSSGVYVHTGVITNLSASYTDWKYVRPANFNQAEPTLITESLGGNKWRFRVLSGIRSYYGVPAGETILKIAILFRSADGNTVQRNADGSDMYVPVYAAGIQTRLTNPFKQPTYKPIPEPINITVGQSLAIEAKASQASNMRLLLNGAPLNAQAGVTTISANPVIGSAGNQRIISEAETGGITSRDTIDFFLPGNTVTEALPAGVAANGVTYQDGNTAATLVLYAPNKSNIVVVGDFNEWTPSITHQMKRTPDGLRFWIKLTGLTPGVEYAYQYMIDGNLKVADYNTEKILDPWNDPSIPVSTYPALKPYPTGKTTDIVSVLQPGKPPYNWVNLNFVRPDKRNLMVYEILLRDYSAEKNFQAAINNMEELASLGINTIHLMPFTEFENNNSWGYNPSFMYAVDKFYGPENKLRELIDSAHGRGIAVILDMVLNHQFGQSPMVRMYWDASLNKPALNSPWFNQDARHPFNVGYDMNHEAPATIEFVENVMRHWLTNFKLDGFRWDLSKGFTQTNNPGDVNAWSSYDQSRVNIWDRIYTQSQAISPGCYMILEHLGVDQEEAELAKKGMILWGKMSNEFSEAAMGYINGTSNFQRAYHTTRWTPYSAGNLPLLMSYAESHDEDRIFYRNRRYGNSTQSGVPPYFQDAKNPIDAALRMQAVGAFLFTIPGPKMIWQWGEYGYDAGINMCENYTTPQSGEDCRLAPKPLVTAMPQPFNQATVPPGGFTFTNYKTVTTRSAMRNMYARILRLRTADDGNYLSTFTGSNISFDLANAFKSHIIQSNDLRLVVIGNFEVTQQSGSVTFPNTGTWQVYASSVTTGFSSINPNLSATQLNVTSTSQTFNNLPPGTFFLFTDRPIVLPIHLLSFTAQRLPQYINLVWRTQQEQHVAGFEIERSFDGLNYEVIGNEKPVNAAGLSINNYRFADQDPRSMKAHARIFYQIRMNDKNGDHSYSQVEVVDPVGSSVKTAISPNPVNSSSSLTINFPEAGNYTIRVVNTLGQVVGTLWNGPRDKGTQTILLAVSAGFSTARISNGTYYLKVEGAGLNQTLPFVKTN